MTLSSFEKFLLIVIGVLLISAVILYFCRRKYTQERFAFIATFTMVSLLTTGVLPLLAGESFLTLLIRVINHFSEQTLPLPKDVGLVSQTLVIVGFIYVCRSIVNIHRDWNGAVSVRRKELERLHQNSGFLQDAVAQLKYVIKERDKLAIAPPDEEQTPDRLIKPKAEDSLAWHVQVAELLRLISSQYKIDIEQDWYAEHSAFISSYGKQKQLLGIYCALNEPTESDLTKFIAFANTHDESFHKIVVAVRNGDSFQRTETISGIEVEFRYETEMLSNLVDFDDYFQAIEKQYLEEEITEGCGFAINDIYVECHCKTQEGNDIEHIEDYIVEWTKSKGERRHLAILGEYGQGKSVLALSITYRMLNSYYKKTFTNSRIPILIVLRGKSPRTLGHFGILKEWAGDYGIDPRAMLKLHKAGKLMLILEGFDEMDLIGDQEMRLNHFERLWEFESPKAKILFTGRPNFFFDDGELALALGTEPHMRDEPYCETLNLKLFSPLQMEAALRLTPNEIRNQILSLIEGASQNKSFSDLVSRPSTLFMVSQIWEERKLNEKREQINSASIIGDFIYALEYNYARQREKEGVGILSVYEREYFMIGIAIGMVQLNGYSNQIANTDLQNLVKTLYQHIPDKELSQLPAMQNSEFRTPLKERLAHLDFAEESVLLDVHSCGIIVNDLSRANHFRYAHKSFLEYLVSYYVYNVFISMQKTPIALATLTETLKIRINLLRPNRETIVFITELVRQNRSFNKNDKEISLLWRQIHRRRLSSYFSPRFCTWLLSFGFDEGYFTSYYVFNCIMILGAGLGVLFGRNYFFTKYFFCFCWYCGGCFLGV